MPKRDLDAQWAKKNDASYYSCKNSINIDEDHGFISKYDVSPANTHDSQMMPALISPMNRQSLFYGDSTYAGDIFKEFLSAAGFESFIHEKGHKSKPLSEANKAFNTGKSRIRALVEHVFGQIVMTMKGKHTRLNSQMRVQGWRWLRKLTVTMRRRAMKLA